MNTLNITPEERRELAEKVGLSEQYIYHLMYQILFQKLYYLNLPLQHHQH